MKVQPWKRTDSKYVLKNRWLSVRADSCVTAAGIEVAPYYVLEYPDWVHIVAFDSESRVLVTQQYRHAAGRSCLEIPCGAIDSGEKPATAARRELLEETGCTVEVLEPLSTFSPNPATHTNSVYTFVAREATLSVPPSPDPTEDISFEFMPVERVMASIDSGDFCQGLHVASLMLALREKGMQ